MITVKRFCGEAKMFIGFLFLYFLIVAGVLAWFRANARIRGGR